MTESTNLEYIKTSYNLEHFDENVGPLNSSQYIRFKSYQLGNTITNSVPTLNQLVPPNNINIFNIDRDPSNCPQYDCTSNSRIIRDPHNLTIPVIVPPNLSVPTGVLTNIRHPLTEKEKLEQKYTINDNIFEACNYSLYILRGSKTKYSVC